MEHCCFCRARTRFWYAKKDVAVCQACAKIHPASDVPTKEEWLAKERAFDQLRHALPLPPHNGGGARE